jgi:microfibrillar-associated protein 1
MSSRRIRDLTCSHCEQYTHLKDQDTTQGGWDRALRRGPESGLATTEGCFNCAFSYLPHRNRLTLSQGGGPHLKRDCPNTDGPSASGTNTSNLVGQRSWGGPPAGRERDDGARREPYPESRGGRDADRPPRDYVKRGDDGGHRDRERYDRERDHERDDRRSYDEPRRSHRDSDSRPRRRSRSRSPSGRRDDYRERDRDRERDYRR